MKRRGFLGALAAFGVGSRFLNQGPIPAGEHLPDRITPPAGGWLMSGGFIPGTQYTGAQDPNTDPGYRNARIIPRGEDDE